ncbi:hypothetical protein A6R68_07538, partial [Neotoma lepida]
EELEEKRDGKSQGFSSRPRRLLEPESCHFTLPPCWVSRSNWSPRSETLELKVTREDVTQALDPGSAVTPGSTLQSYK